MPPARLPSVAGKLCKYLPRSVLISRAPTLPRGPWSSVPSRRAANVIRHCNNGEEKDSESTDGKRAEMGEPSTVDDKPIKPDAIERDDGNGESVKEYRKQLQQRGVDRETANRILQIWKEKGTDDPEQLRRLFVKGSIRPLGAGLAQLLLDVGASYGAFYAGNVIGSLDPFLFQGILKILIYSASFYYLTSAILDIATLTALGVATFRFGANSQAFLDAVRQLAGENQVGVLAKANAVVNTLKVVQVLNELVDILKEKAAEDASKATTLENLSTFLSLSKAEKDYDFDPDKYGLSTEEAARIASSFAEADLNDDGVLEISELKNLCDTLGTTLSDDELEEAIRLLDTNRNNVIDFNEFVDFWVNKVNVPADTRAE